MSTSGTLIVMARKTFSDDGFDHVKLADMQTIAMKVGQSLLAETVRAGGSRQVVAATSVAVFKSVLAEVRQMKEGDNRLSTHEQVMYAAEQVTGRKMGIAELCKTLRSNGQGDLAATVSSNHRCRNLVAYPSPQLVDRVRAALGQMQTAEEQANEGIGVVL